MKIKFGLGCMVLLVWGIVLPDSLRAQNTIQKGSIEIAASGGYSAGLSTVDKFTDIADLIADLASLTGSSVTFDPGSNSKWNIGFSGGYAIRPDFMLVGEIAKTRLVNPTVTLSSLANPLEFKAGLLETTGGIQYQIPLKATKIAPFVGVAIGAARSNVSLQHSPFQVLDVNFSNYHFTQNFGGGARIYFSRNWGVRPELKIVHISNETWFRIAAGVFYQFNN